VPESEISNPEILVTEEFIGTHEELLLFCIYSLVQAALKAQGAVDSDVLAALEALIQTHRTRESGLVYETRPANSIAASVQREFAASVTDHERLRMQREGLGSIRNADMLAILVFLHRLGQQNQNGRPRGRMYLDLLRQMLPKGGIEERQGRIIL
jgi:hypothetical protein